ncbi:MAG: type IV secretion system DNA-binding domain-containing protein [Rhodospirillales bacterium]|nr:type IV secretion system DNA-binding domain-containing protein [Rhodospirillales bacterium]
MALDQRKYEKKHTDILRDIRPMRVRLADWLSTPTHAFVVFLAGACGFYYLPSILLYGDFIFIIYCLYFWWLVKCDRTLIFKMPYGAKWKDKNNMGPGKNGKAEGILYLGNGKNTKEEIWFTNSDARTHVLYLGTTGAGKTEGLKSMVTNAMTWASGFVYIDGKADTDLWSSLSALVRRFGRDDDLLVLNYMTGNSDARAPSNSMNPFSSGSASYLTNMLVSLMPQAEGDNAMWKERAVSLISSLMPAMTWKRDNQDIPLSVSVIRESLNLNNIIKLSRDQAVPEDLRVSIRGYLDTLPGYVDEAFDDQGKEKPPGPDTPAYDTTTPRQQHGYLSMQFTRSLQSLGDDYGYIFDTQAADVDMLDVVLNRRILIVLIPALEKSSDETANLGKIVAATIKGMMGSTLGATVEGESSTVIENKPTHSSTPFMTVFDEVGYYTAEGMAVMAAQARSLGFSLVFSAQDLPALEKRVKEEARSITANCNIKIFGKLEDPTQTKEFFEKTVGQAIVIETSGFEDNGAEFGSYFDTGKAGMQIRSRASYDGLRDFKEGEALICFGKMMMDTQIFYSNPGHAKAMRVTRFVALPPPDDNFIKHSSAITSVRDKMVHKTWTALKADVAVETPDEIAAMADTFDLAEKADITPTEAGMAAIASVHALHNPLDLEEKPQEESTGSAGESAPPPPLAAPAKQPETSAPAAPATPPLTATKPTGPVETSATPPVAASTSANPMSFFASKKSDGAAEPQTPPPPAQPTEKIEQQPDQSVSWQDLVKETEETPPAAPATPAETEKQTPPPVEAAPAALDPAVEATLKEAGEKAKEALRGKGDGDAAE